MAGLPTKEAVVVILDVGASMIAPTTNDGDDSSCTGERATTRLDAALRATALLVQQKLVYTPGAASHEHVGLVLFGTRATRNDIAAQAPGAYQHVFVAHDLAPPTCSLLRYVSAGCPGALSAADGGDRGDLVDALVVAMDMLVKHTGTRRFQRRIFMITDAGSPASASQLDSILAKLSTMDFKLNVIGLGFSSSPDDADDGDAAAAPAAAADAAAAVDGKSLVKVRNEALIRRIAKAVNGTVVPITHAIELMSYFKTRSVLQRTTFRGRLEVSPSLHIGVHSFVKTKEQTFPSLERVTMHDRSTPVKAQMGRDLRSALDPDTSVSHEESVKAYRYGRSLIPFSRVDEAAFKMRTERCLRLIGFTDARTVPRQHFMDKTDVVVADPNDPYARRAFSALVLAMAKKDKIAICRYVRAKDSPPILVGLIPCPKASFDRMYMAVLPFTEDLRSFPFVPLTPTDPRSRKIYHPTQEQSKAAQQLITGLDLMDAEDDPENGPGAKMEGLKPRRVFNPSLQRFFQVVQHKALHPGDPLPPPEPSVLHMLEPNGDLCVRASPAIQEFQRLFKLEKAPEVQKAEKRSYWSDRVDDASRDIVIAADGAVPAADESGAPDSKKQKIGGFLSVDALIARGINAVGSVSPVKDFDAMLSRRDTDLVATAIEQMASRIRQFVNDSIGGQYYPKALECVASLRRGCVQEDEPKAFNDLLQQLRREFEGRERDSFWRMVAGASISLIHTGESLYSSVTQEEAAKFHEARPAPAPAPRVPEPKRGESMDDLFQMAD